MANKRIRKKLEKRRNTIESRLLAAMQEAVEIEQGERDPVRVTVVERLPDGSIARRTMTGAEWRASGY